MFFHRSLLLGVRTFAVVPLLVLALSSPWGRGRRAELFVMWSSDDPSLRTQIAALSPTVSPDEARQVDRKSTRLNSSHVSISYAVFCLKKKITLKIISIGSSIPVSACVTTMV